MKTTVSTIAILAMMATPALAWTNTTNGNGPQQIVDGGPGAQATSAARSTSNATGGNARATGGNASASGGTGYGGAGGNGYGGQGGRGGSASSSALGGVGGTGGSSSSSIGNVSISGNGGGSGGGSGGRAPDIFLPSIGAAGNDCPTVGFGAAGSGLGGGGGFGPSWISTDCNNRKISELLLRMGYPAAALAVLSDTFPQVKQALAETTPVQPVAAVPATSVGWNRAAWCDTASPAERRRYVKECK